MIRVSIVDDDDEIRESLALIINGTEGCSCISTYNNCEKAIEEIPQNPPNVILMDIELPGMSGIEGISKLRKLVPTTDFIMLTVFQDDEIVFESLCAGASGYLTKNVQPVKLLNSIKEVCEGGSPMSENIARLVVKSFQLTDESPLTPRETEVLTLLSKGKSYKMIADDLFISRETVHSHIKNIYHKLNVHSETEAVAAALKKRLIT